MNVFNFFGSWVSNILSCCYTVEPIVPEYNPNQSNVLIVKPALLRYSPTCEANPFFAVSETYSQESSLFKYMSDSLDSTYSSTMSSDNNCEPDKTNHSIDGDGQSDCDSNVYSSISSSEHSEQLNDDVVDSSVTTTPGNFFVYCLESNKTHSTYIGATIDVFQRLRKHNCEIKGGAVQTGKRVRQGETWRVNRYVCGFPTWQAALQFEWRWKNISRTVAKKMHKTFNVEVRCNALQILLALEKSTTKAIPYKDWQTPPKVIIPEQPSQLLQSIQSNQSIDAI